MVEQKKDPGTVDAAGSMEPKPITVVNPEARPFTLGKGQIITVLTGHTGNAFRLFHGACGLDYKVRLGKKAPGQYSAGRFLWMWDILETARPTSSELRQPIEVYEFELSAYSRKVREAVSCLGLDMAVFPCPQKGTTYRPRVLE